MQRSPWVRVGLTLCGMALVLLLAASWRYLVSRGVFTSVPEISPGVCRTVPSVSDVTAILVTPAGRYGTFAAVATQNGKLFGTVFGQLMYGPFSAGNLKPLSGFPASSHAVALSEAGQTGARVLQVLLRRDHEYAVSSFRYGAELEEVGRLTTDVLTDPADLTSVDGSRFYLVNRHGTHTAFGKWLDDTFLLPRADILYFDGMKFVTVAKRLNSPAGLALSPDGRHLYVAEDYPRALITFMRNDFTGALEDPQVLPIASGLGKISVASNGDLIIAARPKAGAGQVWHVKVQNGVPQSAELVYSKKGETVTAAAGMGGHLLIGTGHGLIDCTQ